MDMSVFTLRYCVLLALIAAASAIAPLASRLPARPAISAASASPACAGLRSASALMGSEEESRQTATIGYVYVGLLTASVFAAAIATSTGSPPNGLAIVAVSFAVAAAVANSI